MRNAPRQRRWIFGFVAVGVLLAFSASAPAQDSILYFPDGKLSPCTAAIFPWYSTTIRELRLQVLVPATALPSVATQVREIGFLGEPSANRVFTPELCQIRIAHTSKTTSLSTTFAHNLESNVTEVFRGPLRLTQKGGSWSDVRLTRSFLYNGRSNLVLDFRWKETVGISSFVGCGTTSAVVVINRYKGAYDAGRSDGFGLNPGAMCKIRFKTNQAILLSGGSKVRPGGKITYALHCPPDAGLTYQVGTALNHGPIWIGNRRISLTPDSLLAVSVQGLLPSIFVGYAGKLSSLGQGSATAVVPNDKRLVGTQLHTAFVTVDSKAPSGMKSISNAASVTISQ